MTASRSLHRSAGIDFRHCLDRRKSPGKKTEPAARMDSMIPDDPSERQKVPLGSLVIRLKKNPKTAKCQQAKESFLLYLSEAPPISIHVTAHTDNKQDKLSKSNMCHNWECCSSLTAGQYLYWNQQNACKMFMKTRLQSKHAGEKSEKALY